MKRLARFLSCVFLFLTIALGLMWVRSYFYSESLTLEKDPLTTVRLDSKLGIFSVSIFGARTGWLGPTQIRSERVRHDDDANAWFIEMTPQLGIQQYISVPYWVLFSVSLALCYWNHRNAHRQPRGHCQSCGYDLRGTNNACPECGAAKA